MLARMTTWIRFALRKRTTRARAELGQSKRNRKWIHFPYPKKRPRDKRQNAMIEKTPSMPSQTVFLQHPDMIAGVRSRLARLLLWLLEAEPRILLVSFTRISEKLSLNKITFVLLHQP